MKTKTNTKKALISSLFSFALLAGTMVLGGTFAWFTSEARNSNNKINVGTLDVQLWEETAENVWTNLETINKPIFNLDNFCPGDEYETTLRIVNSGSIELQYNLTFEGLKNNEAVQEVLDIYVEGLWIAPLDRFQDSGSIKNGTLAPQAMIDFDIKIAFYTGAGNIYQGLEVSPFDILLSATQLNNPMTIKHVSSQGVVREATEYASLSATSDTQIDVGAVIATLPADTVVGALTEANATSANIQFAAEVVNDNSANFVIGNGSDDIITFDLSLTVNGQAVTTFGETAGVPNEIQITRFITPGLPFVKVVYYALDGTPEVLRSTYDNVTGELNFWTTHFSRFYVECDVDTIVNDGHSIQTAIDNANPGDTIFIAPGLYSIEETIVINKKLTLLGNNAGIDAKSIRAQETILVPSSSELFNYYFQSVILEITSPEVIVDGITFDGDNPNVTNIWTSEKHTQLQDLIAVGSPTNDTAYKVVEFLEQEVGIGNDIGVDGGVGIYIHRPTDKNGIVYPNISNVAVKNSIVKNFSQYGVLAYNNRGNNHANDLLAKDVTVANNYFENIMTFTLYNGTADAPTYAGHYGRAIGFETAVTGSVLNNVIKHSGMGISLYGNYNVSELPMYVAGNALTDVNTGIWVNATQLGKTTEVYNNSFTMENNLSDLHYSETTHSAIAITSLYNNSASVTGSMGIHDNRISNYEVGILAASIPAFAEVHISANNFDSVGKSIYVSKQFSVYSFLTSATTLYVHEDNVYNSCDSLQWDVLNAGGVITIVEQTSLGEQTTRKIGKLLTPTSFALNQKNQTITWKAVTNAEGYEVYVDDSYIAFVAAPTVTFSLSNLTEDVGTSFTIKIKAVNYHYPELTDSDFTAPINVIRFTKIERILTTTANDVTTTSTIYTVAGASLSTDNFAVTKANYEYNGWMNGAEIVQPGVTIAEEGATYTATWYRLWTVKFFNEANEQIGTATVRVLTTDFTANYASLGLSLDSVSHVWYTNSQRKDAQLFANACPNGVQAAISLYLKLI